MGALAEGWGAFAARFAASTGVSPWLVTGAVLTVVALYRLLRALRHERAEVSRRRALVEETRAFLQEAIWANEAHLRELEQLRVLAHGEAEVLGASIESLSAVRGVGRKTIDALKRAGFLRVGDLRRGQPMRVRGVGPVRGRALLETVNARLGDMKNKATRWRAGDRVPFPRHPEVDEAFDAHRARLLRRNETLDGDLGSFPALAAEVEAFAAEAEQRGADARIRAVFEGWIGLAKAPARLLGRTFFVVAGLSLVAALPRVVTAWDPTLRGPAAVVGAGAAWAVLHVGLLVHFVFAERPHGWGLQVPKPDAFNAQRLQFVALKWAHRLGIAPPRVALVDLGQPNAFAVGRPAGPSVVGIDGLLAKALDEDALRAIVGHELGHLRGDDARRRLTARTLFAPIRHAKAAALRLVAELGLRARYRVITDAHRIYLAPRFGLATFGFAALLLPVGLIAFALTGLWLALRTLEGLSSRIDEFQADRVAAELAGDPLPMAEALRQVDGLMDRMVRAPFAGLSLHAMPGDRGTAWRTSPGAALGMRLDRFEDRVGTSHPSTPARVAALQDESPVVGDLLLAAAKLALVVALTGALLWGALRGLSLATDWGVERYHAWTAVAAEPEERAAPSWTIRPARGCHLRAGPKKSAESLAVLARGTRCEADGEPRGRWHPVRCGDARGFAHAVCLEQVRGARPGGADSSAAP